MAAVTPVAAPSLAPASRRWLHGAVPDLFLGCGLAYVAVFLGLCVVGPSASAFQPMLIPFLLIVLAGIPHYGATLLRVYERPQDRRAYVFFTVYVTTAVWLAFALGLHWIGFGSLWLTIYLTWSPWHYTGQNYGLAVMFLRRRGVALDDGTKRLLYTSFVLSFVLTVLTMHGNGPTATYAPASYAGTVYRFLPLGLPYWVRAPGIVLTAVAYAAVLALAFGRLLRVARPADLAPTALLAASQSLWFALPVLVREWSVPGLAGLEPFRVDQAAYTFLWIAAAHSVQYLWVTSYYAAASGPEQDGKAAYLAKTLVAGAAIWTVPTVLFAPGLLGRISHDAGLALLTSATVNLHHFVLDGAIWKLRDGRVARVLLRSAARGEAAAPADAPPRRRWLAPLVWASGVASVAIIFGSWWVQNVELANAAAAGNLPRAERAVRQLGWMKRDTPDHYVQIARLKLKTHDLAGARASYRRSLAVSPTADAYLGLGALDEADQRWSDAVATYDKVLQLNPDHVIALHRSGIAWLALGERAKAKAVLERAVALSPDDKLLKLSLTRAEAEGG
jgi:tetratricopeptide (TPR) repeat protein